MIISASYRSDIPAFYAPWFAGRLKAGYAMVANPYGGRPYRADLAHAPGFVFWTRNIIPLLPVLTELRQANRPFTVQYSLTGYPRTLDVGTPSPARAIAAMAQLRQVFGPRVVVWRYDPILISSVTPADFHLRNFAKLAASLRGICDEACISFTAPYRKTRRNLDQAAKADDFTWCDPDLSKKNDLAAALADIAARHGMVLTGCTQPELNIPAALCIDVQRLSDIAGREISARPKGNRAGCLCAQSRDIGAYDSCTHGCVYCYAVNHREIAAKRMQSHDPGGEFLIPLP